jgi:GalNAc-alpha-(1->4)-GalNAc-alpha-(1->3)-diNAcBac-PP-undecaprenol alpha-1,4-N-acetyl-D-galactosaminyltransferase
MERVMSELANYFCQKPGIEVHLVLYGIDREIFYKLSKSIIIYKPTFVFSSTLRTYSTLRTMSWLRKTIKRINPCTVLSFGELWNSFVLLSMLGLKFPVFVSDRCQPNKSLALIHDRLRKWLYPRAAGVICQTETARRLYQKMFRHKNFIVIGNPIRFIKSNSSIQKENIILSVGRLVKTKHHDELIRIFAELDLIGWKLIIVGDDALKQDNNALLQQLINDLGMQDKVELAGKRKDVEDYYNRAKIFAFTSSSEGFPNVIGEAMSAGLPVIAYDCVAGPRELIQHGQTGFLTNLHNTEDYQNKLKLLIEDKELREQMGIAGQEKVKQFATGRIAEKFQKIILSESITN